MLYLFIVIRFCFSKLKTKLSKVQSQTAKQSDCNFLQFLLSITACSNLFLFFFFFSTVVSILCPLPPFSDLHRMVQFVLWSNPPMASLPQHHHSHYDRAFFGPMFPKTRRSTSQTCLHKILRTITTVPPPPLSSAIPPCAGSQSEESSPAAENRGSGFELKIGFSVPQPVASGLSSTSATAVEGGGSSAALGGGCFKDNRENGVIKNSRIKSNIGEAESSMTLLIEAARLIFGEFKDGDEPESSDSPPCYEVKKDGAAADIEPEEEELPRRSSCWTAADMGGEFEEPPSSPVVRSKRGRTQVLPCKYRDSVLEPLTRLSRTGSSIHPSKRRWR